MLLLSKRDQDPQPARAPRQLVLAVILVVASFAGSLTVRGQATDAFPLPILVVACDHDPRSLTARDAVPDGCEPLAGVELSVEARDQSFIGECVTGPDGTCAVSAPAYEQVIVVEAVETIPAGYRPVRNPRSKSSYASSEGVAFVNVPDTLDGAGSATLTIHNRNCPAGYSGDDYYGDCHDNPGASTVFFLTGPRSADRATGSDGNVTFADLPPGRYSLVGGRPIDFVAYWFFCSASDAPGVPIPIEQLGQGAYAGIGIELAPGDDVICDWYNTPADLGGAEPDAPAAPMSTTVLIYARNCPRSYPEHLDLTTSVDPSVRRNFRFSNRTIGDTWGTVITDFDGFASIDLTYRSLPYQVTMDVQFYLGWYEVQCWGGDGREIPITYDRVGIWIHSLLDGEEVICNWYFVHAPLGENEPRG